MINIIDDQSHKPPDHSGTPNNSWKCNGGEIACFNVSSLVC